MLNFGIPQGFDGRASPQGLPGEVTNADLQAAINTVTNGSSANSNGVSTLGQSADPLYNQSQMQALFDKMDELINALRR